MNKYEVLGVVGEGAYGVVLKCRNKESGEVVAIKKFKEEEAAAAEGDDALRKTALREVKILRLLRHANIVSLMEAFRRKGKLYLVFEYVERNLLEVLESHPQGLGDEGVLLYVFQLCQAINWCHSNNVIHRDIKPENLLINTRTKLLKLCDFGFARIVTRSTRELTDYVATRWYRAPELLLGSTDYGFSVDMWAIGCIMGEITDGQPMFPGESEVDQLFIIQKVLGPLIPEHIDMFASNARFAGLKFPDMSRPETLQKKYVGKFGKSALHFLQALLRMNPADRPTSRDALAHPFFDRVPKSFLPSALPAPAQSQPPPKQHASQTSQQQAQQPSNHISGHRKRIEEAGQINKSGITEGGDIPPRQLAMLRSSDGSEALVSLVPVDPAAYLRSGVGGSLALAANDLGGGSVGSGSSLERLDELHQMQMIPGTATYLPTDLAGARAETPVGNPPSRQKGRRSRAAASPSPAPNPTPAQGHSLQIQQPQQFRHAPQGDVDLADVEQRERARLRELEKEGERARERQREFEMKSLRDFSKLPVLLRAPNARNVALSGGTLQQDALSESQYYQGGYVAPTAPAQGLTPIQKQDARLHGVRPSAEISSQILPKQVGSTPSSRSSSMQPMYAAEPKSFAMNYTNPSAQYSHTSDAASNMYSGTSAFYSQAQQSVAISQLPHLYVQQDLQSGNGHDLSGSAAITHIDGAQYLVPVIVSGAASNWESGSRHNNLPLKHQNLSSSIPSNDEALLTASRNSHEIFNKQKGPILRR